MRHVFLSALILLAAVSAHGQAGSPPLQPCTLKLSQAPAIRGVRLGMTVDELLPLFPGSNENPTIKNSLSAAEGYPQFGEGYFGISPSNWPSKERFAGINNYGFRFFDRRIVGITVMYERFPEGARWKDAMDLIQKFSDSLHLPPPKDWVNDPYNPRKTLKCDGFEVTVVGGDQASIGFYAQGWDGTKRERLAAFEEQKRREFKP